MKRRLKKKIDLKIISHIIIRQQNKHNGDPY
jgi:hypothetical protein